MCVAGVADAITVEVALQAGGWVYGEQADQRLESVSEGLGIGAGVLQLNAVRVGRGA
jgi:hypothetical protein